MRAQKVILSILLSVITLAPISAYGLQVTVTDLSNGESLSRVGQPAAPGGTAPTVVGIFGEPVPNSSVFINSLIVFGQPGRPFDTVVLIANITADVPRVQIDFVTFPGEFGERREADYSAGFVIQGNLSGGSIMYSGIAFEDVIIDDSAGIPRPHIPPPP